MAVKLIYNHVEHHATRSGYDQLAKHVDGEPYRTGPLFRLAEKLPGSYAKAYPSGDASSRSAALSRELEICGRVLLPTKHLYHFFDAEHDLRLASAWPLRLNNKIIATFHQPPEQLENRVKHLACIRGLSAAVVVSRSQIPSLTRFLPRGRIFHVPHGVDYGYWCPDPRTEKWPEPTFVFVDSCSADTELFAQAVRQIAMVAPDVRFRIVTTSEHAAIPEHSEAAGELPNTTVRLGISDEERREEYRRAHGLFLPLKAATANSSVLEALSCGVAVITTDSGGVVEYVDEHSTVAVPPGDVDAAAASVCAIASDRDRMRRMGEAARRRAKRYRWEAVGAQMSYIYRRILGESAEPNFHQSEPGPRNICLLTEEYPPETGRGGIATYGYNLAQGLGEAGHRVYVLAGCLEEPSTTHEGNVEVHRIKFAPPPGWRGRLWRRIVRPLTTKYPEFQRRLEFALAARERFKYLFDRVPMHILEAPEYFGSAYFIQRMRKRCPVAIKLHTPTEVNFWINSLPVTTDVRLSNILEKGSAKRADLVTAPSQKIIDIVRERWLPSLGDIQHLEYPIDAALYSPAEDEAADGPRHFLFTGRLEHRKGVHVLVQAFDRVSDDIGDVELHLAGHDTPTFSHNGAEPVYFEEYMKGMDLRSATRDKIKFLGRIPLRELIPLYRSAYACIVPSVSFENFPNSCLEAIACGKAVIVSDAGGMAEMAPHEVSGLVVGANDVESLAGAIRYLADHPDDADRFGKSGRQIVLERYATEKIVSRTVAAFESVIARGRYR